MLTLRDMGIGALYLLFPRTRMPEETWERELRAYGLADESIKSQGLSADHALRTRMRNRL
jgi:hypothetical protein